MGALYIVLYGRIILLGIPTNISFMQFSTINWYGLRYKKISQGFELTQVQLLWTATQSRDNFSFSPIYQNYTGFNLSPIYHLYVLLVIQLSLHSARFCLQIPISCNFIYNANRIFKLWELYFSSPFDVNTATRVHNVQFS